MSNFLVPFAGSRSDTSLDVITKDLTKLSKLIFLTIVGTIEFIKSIITLYLIWPFLYALEFVLYVARMILKESLKIIGPVVEVVFKGLDLAINIIVDALNGICDAIDTITFGGVDISVPKVHFSKIVKVVVDACNAFDVCDKINTMSWEVFHFVKLQTYDLCAAVRLFWPIDFMYDALSWMFDSIIFDPNPTTGPGCTVPEYYTFCFVVNFYQIIKFVIAVIFIIIFIASYWKPAKYALSEFVIPFIVWILELFHLALKRVWEYIFQTNKKKHTNLSDNTKAIA